MRSLSSLRPLGWAATVVLLSGFQANRGADTELAAIVRSYLGMSLPADWRAIEALPGIRWAALPPTMLQNCLPDGGCFTRQGVAALGGRNAVVLATGARTMVGNIYVRNGGAAIGEAAAVAALGRAGFTVQLARCPIRGGAGSTSWYRLGGDGVSAGVLAIQGPRGNSPTEGFVISPGEELPALQPNQLALYSTACEAGAPQAPVATAAPHERLAEVVTALLVPSSTAALTWAELPALATGIAWNGTTPRPMDRSVFGDTNPVAMTGSVTWSERRFSAVASGTTEQVRLIALEEMGMHPRGEHMLGVVYTRGIAVRLVRCGPVYSESTNNWYSLTSPRTRPAMIRQSIRYEGNQVQDSYELRLDGSLPARDPRDRDPGVNGCQ